MKDYKDYKEKLNESNQKISYFKSELELARSEKSELIKAECLKIHKVKIGSIIKEDEGKGELVKVTAVLPHEDQSRQPSLKGVKKKKNDEWSIREVHVWAWTNNWILISE